MQISWLLFVVGIVVGCGGATLRFLFFFGLIGITWASLLHIQVIVGYILFIYIFPFFLIITLLVWRVHSKQKRLLASYHGHGWFINFIHGHNFFICFKMDKQK